MFAGQVKIVSQLSCRTSAILKYFCPLVSFSLPYAGFDLLLGSHTLAFLEVCFVLVLPGNLACVNGPPRNLTYAWLSSQVPKSLPCASALWNFGLIWGLP